MFLGAYACHGQIPTGFCTVGVGEAFEIREYSLGEEAEQFVDERGRRGRDSRRIAGEARKLAVGEALTPEAHSGPFRPPTGQSDTL
jgi:hypothetical protein